MMNFLCSNVVVTTTVVVCGLVLPLLWSFYGRKLFPLGYNEAYLTFTNLERTSNSVRRYFVTFTICSLGVKTRNLKVDFKTGGTWHRVEQ